MPANPSLSVLAGHLSAFMRRGASRYRKIGYREPGAGPNGEEPAMSDEQQRRGDGSGLDRTQQFDPYAEGAGADETTARGGSSAPGAAAQADQNQPVGGPRSGDARTEAMPRTGGGDETVLTPRPDATSVMPAVPGPAATGPGATGPGGAWSGRAEVRPPRPPQRDFPSGSWDVVPPPPREPRGKWWSPIVIGIVVLVLLALLGWGLWLIVSAGSDDGDPPTPAATTTAAATATTEPASAATTEPTTQPTTTEPTGPAEVTIPALKGLSSAEAREALDRKGLSYRLRFVTSGDATPGTVIDSDPQEGQQVPPDTTVTLIIAAAPSSAPTVSTTPATTEPTDTTGN
jgi:hypothetical protein